MKILCIYNPKAGGGKAPKYLKQIKTYLEQYQIEADIIFTRKKYRASEILADYGIHYDALIAAGGDGTFFDLLNAYMKFKTHNVPLGIIPIGTGNSLSRDIATTSKDLKHFINIIAQQKTKLFDIARVEAQKNTFYFANMIGLGFSVDVTQTALRYKFIGKIAYIAGVLHNTVKLNTYPLRLKINGFDKKEIRNTFITVSNSKYSGNDFLLAPKASVNDGKLDLVVVNKISRIDLLKTFPKIFDGSYINSPYVDYYQTDKIELSSPHRKLLSPDGEILGELPATISCLPSAVQVLTE